MAVVPLGDYDTEHPTFAHLIIEVAESSLKRDRGLKQRIYARAGIPEYWIVNTVERSIEVYRDPSEESYGSRERVLHEGSVSPHRFSDVVVRVSDVMR